MQTAAKSRASHLRWLTLAVSVLVLFACTSFAAHIDKAAGDDGKGHCSICLGATAHIVPPMAVVQVAPVLVAAAVAPSSDRAIKQDRFASSLYIRPPPAR